MKYIKDQIIVITYFLLAIFIELYALKYVDCSSFIKNPLYPLFIIGLAIFILLAIKSKRIQFIVTICLLFVQVLLCTAFIFLYDCNGTVFEWSMVNQRNDAFGTLEQLDLKWKYIIPCVIVVVAYIVSFIFILHYERKKGIYKANINKPFRISSWVTGALCLILVVLLPAVSARTQEMKDYTKLLYKESGSEYQNKGIVGNALYEVVKGGLSKKIDVSDVSDVDDFIYKEKAIQSDYFGISSDNNLIMILVESLEWYPLTIAGEYSNILYPNITSFMNNGVYANSFYNREKTDTSEALSILGNYPTGKFVHYDFPNVVTPFSLPNMIKSDAASKGEEITMNSYHHNYREFYNRHIAHETWGFEKFYGIENMKEYGVEDNWKHRDGERNLDSVMMECMKEKMFPTDERFFSYILSFSMHGNYNERNSLAPYYAKLDEYNLCPKTKNIFTEYLRTYMAAVMDFDKALGIMMDYLESKSMLDNTTIILFSDHNTYYNNLSYYAKDIDRDKETFNSNLYNIPFMMYDEKLSASLDSNVISKYTTTSDIVPTVLDLFGIPSWKNIYFGSSMFTEKESIAYSRAYGMFIEKGLVCTSIKDILYRSKDFTKEDLDYFEQRAKEHLGKLEYVDKIWYSDFFKNNEYKTA